jgi:serine protease AprX
MSNIIVIKALNQVGETTTVKILESMQWIMDNKDKYNIRVVCMSFGSVSSSIEDPLVRGAEILWNNGIVVVCAAGNNGPNSATIMSPGVSRKIITVGSIDSKDNQVADFSSRGPTIVGGYKPDVVLPGVDIISISNFTNKEFYTTMSGTSVSTPMVAGVVSLLLNYNERYTPDQIKYMLVNSTIKINGDRNSEGFGKLDLSKFSESLKKSEKDLKQYAMELNALGPAGRQAFTNLA